MLITGEVLLSVVVGTDGIPRDIQIVNPLGFGLDQKAVEAASTWRFNPGMKDGHPVNVRVQDRREFQVRQKPVPQNRWKTRTDGFRKTRRHFRAAGYERKLQPVNGPKDENGKLR